jgi:hypothetical protein
VKRAPEAPGGSAKEGLAEEEALIYAKSFVSAIEGQFAAAIAL